MFPDVSDTPVLKWISGPELTERINDFTNWFVDHVDTYTIAFKNDITNWLINPLQDLLALSPWWLTAGVLLAVAYVLGGWRPTVTTAGLRGRHPRHRAVERHHDHAGHDPGRDRCW